MKDDLSDTKPVSASYAEGSQWYPVLGGCFGALLCGVILAIASGVFYYCGHDRADTAWQVIGNLALSLLAGGFVGGLGGGIIGFFLGEFFRVK